MKLLYFARYKDHEPRKIKNGDHPERISCHDQTYYRRHCVWIGTTVSPAFSQDLDGTPYTPGKDPNIDMFMGSWRDSMPAAATVHSSSAISSRRAIPSIPPVKARCSNT